MPSFVTPLAGEDALAEHVAQIVEDFQGLRNIPLSLTGLNDGASYGLSIKNVGSGGKDIIVYAPDGVTVLFQVDAAGVKISSAGGAAVAPLASGGVFVPPTTDPPAANQLTAGSLVKGWARVTYTAGAPALTDDYNVSGLVDGGVGILTVTWDQDFSNINYAVVGTARGALVEADAPFSTGSTLINMFDYARVAADPNATVCIVAVGDQA